MSRRYGTDLQLRRDTGYGVAAGAGVARVGFGEQVANIV